MSFSAVLLAGGESSRMGKDKATLVFGNEPLWKIQIDKLQQLQPKEIFVSGQTDPMWRPKDAEFVADKSPSCGPISGIAATLSKFRTDHLLVLAIDVPFITEAYLRKLLDQIATGVGVVPMLENRAEPLVAIYPRGAEVEFLAAFGGNDFSLQPLVRKLIAIGKLREAPIAPEERGLFRNLNSPGELPQN